MNEKLYIEWEFCKTPHHPLKYPIKFQYICLEFLYIF
jgi:hypothetical protein